MSLLEVEHLRKKYGDFVALADLSFEVAAGEVLGLLGPNGAGKSTAMMILAGLLPSDGGTVRIDGQPFDQDPARLKQTMGVVPQGLAIYPDLTGSENLRFFGSLYGYSGRELTERANRALADVGLSDWGDKFVRTYSGGMKRRLNFAVGVLHEPRLVILDEPTVGVDPQSRNHLLECVRALTRRGVGVIYCSHYMEEIEALCQRVAIVDHGQLLAYGALEELLDRSRRDLELRVRGWTEALGQRLGGLAQLERVEDGVALLTVPRVTGEGRETAGGQPVESGDMTGRLTEILEAVRAERGAVQTIQTKDYNLERLFLEKTGRRLRD